MDETFDVVDEEDALIRRASRAEVHRLGLRHRAVHVLVFNAAGRLFLQKRSLTKDCFPGTWDSSAAGHLDAGEEYDHAARRELNEELGWTPATPVERLFKIAACAETGQEFVWVYRCQGEGPFRLHPEEIETGAWFDPGVIGGWIDRRPLDFASSLPLIWRELRWRGVRL
jgi:isopentenyldiphosphate isomerase